MWIAHVDRNRLETTLADQHLEDLWRGVVDELLRLSEQATSSVPTLTPQQRAYLRLMKPVVLVDGYALLLSLIHI